MRLSVLMLLSIASFFLEACLQSGQYRNGIIWSRIPFRLYSLFVPFQHSEQNWILGFPICPSESSRLLLLSYSERRSFSIFVPFLC